MSRRDLIELIEKAEQVIKKVQSEIDRVPNPKKPPSRRTSSSYQPPRYDYVPPKEEKKSGYRPQPFIKPVGGAKPVTIGGLRPPSDAGGVFLQIFGFLFGIPIVLATLGMLVGLMAKWSTSVLGVLLFMFLPMCGAAGFAVCKGFSLRARNLRFRRYAGAIGGAKFCEVSRMAAAAGLPEKAVKNDLAKMLRAGLFPGAYLDDQRTCLILDEETYQQYMVLKKSHELKQQEKISQQTAQQNTPPADDEVSELVREGKRYIDQIKDANEALPGEEISNKLWRLETVTSEIFRHVAQHPDKQPEIRRLMQYHLPTTVKLVDTYRRLDLQPIHSENITNIKKEILQGLDAVNNAFEQLLNNLFEDVALDVSSDISVLKTMLAQEGLTDCDDFKK